MEKIPSLKTNKIRKLSFFKRAFFLSSAKAGGGMALEGSLVLPVFLFFMMTVLLSIEGVRFQSNMQEALYQAGSCSAERGYQVKYLGEGNYDTEGHIREYLSDQLYPYLCVAGGGDGIVIKDTSSVNGDGRIELWVEYRLKPFIGWIPIGEIRIRDRFFGHAWTGYSGETYGKDMGQETYVYITKRGEKYHLSHECTYLRVQVRGISYEQIASQRNQSGEKYHPCQRCRPVKGGIVYITADGSSFHGKSDCPSLKRTVYMIPLSEAGAYSACSKCGG